MRERSFAELDPIGFRWLYRPLFLLLGVGIGAHSIGHLAASAVAGDALAAHRPIFRWIDFVEVSCPHRATGSYVLLRLGSVGGAFFATAWLLALALFTALSSNPFIYFQI